MGNVPSILQKIVRFKQDEIAGLPEEFAASSPGSSLYQKLIANKQAGELSIIAECKKGSPSAGIIEADYNPAEVAAAYEKGGATGLSVLTDTEFFFGSLDDLRSVKQVTNLPILRKDFTIDERQIREARAVGASAILLIAAILDETTLVRFHNLATELGLDALVEVHDEAELDKALVIPGLRILGVNNRNLHDFTEDLATTKKLRAYYETNKPADADEVIFVSESAIKNSDDVKTIAPFADAVLVGTSLMRGDSVQMLGEFKTAFKAARSRA